jgi:alpha-ketoglutarate-dependent taurine dioxygenase
VRFVNLTDVAMPLAIYPTHLHERSTQSLASYIRNHQFELLQLVRANGAILFRDFRLDDAKHFKILAQRLVPHLVRYIGGDAPRAMAETAVYDSTSLPPDQVIPMHNEKSYSNSHPETVFFYCAQPARQGGATPLLDGRLLLSRLSPQLIDTFQRKKLKYIQNLPASHTRLRTWKETFETQNKEQVEALLRDINAHYWWKSDETLHIEEIVDPIVVHPHTGAKAFFAQAHRWGAGLAGPPQTPARQPTDRALTAYHDCTFGDDTRISQSFLDEIENLTKSILIRFDWNKNDLLILDNLITQHGRDRYTGDRKIFVAMA